MPVGNAVRVQPSLERVEVVCDIKDTATVIPRNSLIEANQSGLIAEPLIDITPQLPIPEYQARSRLQAVRHHANRCSLARRSLLAGWVMQAPARQLRTAPLACSREQQHTWQQCLTAAAVCLRSTARWTPSARRRARSCAITATSRASRVRAAATDSRHLQACSPVLAARDLLCLHQGSQTLLCHFALSQRQAARTSAAASLCSKAPTCVQCLLADARCLTVASSPAGVAMDDLVYICTKIARQMDTNGLDRMFDAASAATSAIEEGRPLLQQADAIAREVSAACGCVCALELQQRTHWPPAHALPGLLRQLLALLSGAGSCCCWLPSQRGRTCAARTAQQPGQASWWCQLAFAAPCAQQAALVQH